MAFDQTARNRLARFVSDTRSLLAEEFTRQLQNDYGLDPHCGDVTDLARLDHLDDARRETARLLRDTMDHYLAAADTGTPAKAKKARQDVLDRIVREQAFTILNRLCALRMAEARGLLIESIARGYQSKGFQLYQRMAGTALGETGDCYRQFIFSVFDEFAVDLPVLFDRFSLQGRLFPRPTALLNTEKDPGVLDLINAPDIDPLWAEDETIGWIYQYFNSVEERRQMRSESQAPRNSRELAVRNQFFTPRYVVEFLTDNTLGRIWYEMTKGESSLKDSCRYLVRRPNEIFLSEGEVAPELDDIGEELSREELLKQLVHILYRPIKDPRDIKMLDPACGSMHFGLYAFDLFERIYEEAWEIEAQRGADVFVRTEGLEPLNESYSDKDAFLRDVPRLIIERNIHGIDIDPRAVQISGLSLWLRAQRSWQAQNVKALDRPQIQRSNIVCAEPMPGEADILEEFTEQLQPKVLGQLVKIIFEKMKLAGEAGSLLKIEEEIKDAVNTAHAAYQKYLLDQQKDSGYLPGMAPKRAATLFDFADLPRVEDFWNQAETLVITALENYAEHTSGTDASRRRIFVRDAVLGFALIDLWRHRFDVALMNPPFGESARAAASYVKSEYPASAQDILQCFVQRCLDTATDGGLIGVLSARTGFFMGASESWRQDVVWRHQLLLFADLGLGVLDDALVEAAAYTIKNSESIGQKILASRHLSTRAKELSLSSSISQLRNGQVPADLFTVPQDVIKFIPGAVFGYWAPLKFLRRFRDGFSFGVNVSQVRQGLATADDFRFVRLSWEVPASSIGQDLRWSRFSKGGEYSPPYDDIHLVVDWQVDGRLFLASPSCRCQNVAFYHKPGATYTVRTASAFAAKILPQGCVFSHNAQSWFVEDEIHLLASIGYFMARVPQAYLELAVGGGDIATSGSAARRYTTKVVHSIPASIVQGEGYKCIAREMPAILRPIAFDLVCDETSALFSGLPNTQATSIDQAALKFAQDRQSLVSAALAATHRIDETVSRAWKLDDDEFAFVASEIGRHPSEYPQGDSVSEVGPLLREAVDRLIQIGVDRYGASRWFTKKSYFVDRRTELICHLLHCNPVSIEEAISSDNIDISDWAKRCVSQSFGIAIGRWSEINYGQDCTESFVSNPFNSLPQSQPSAASSDSPIVILVEDEGHPNDTYKTVERTLYQIWSFIGADLIEQLSTALGCTVQDWLRREMFTYHLSLHSKSRRVAPVYWPISTPAGSYTIWLYYHRLTDQTLYTCVNDFVDQKLKQVSEDATSLRSKSNRSSAEEKELESLSDLELELKDFRGELLRIARFWKPNLNDGVQITAAPLWNLFQHRQWKARLKETWEKLEAGEYDWAHLALSIWPDRVVRASHKDRSYAIAHDLEDLLWHEVEVEKVGRGGRVTTTIEWQPRDLSSADLQRIIAEVKAR